MAEKEDLIHELAELMGIEPEYADIWGQRHITPLETKVLILTAMGVDTQSIMTVEKELIRHRNSEWLSIGPPVLVMYGDSPKPVPVTVPFKRVEEAGRSLPEHILEVTLTIKDEVGQTIRKRMQGEELHAEGSRVIDGVAYQRCLVDLPAGLDIGYYTVSLLVTTSEDQYDHSLMVVVCPEKAYLPAALEGEGKTGGPAVALYGLRSSRNWGIGDFTDLKNLVDWTVDHLGGGVIGINPLAAIHNRPPSNVSPYMPITNLFRNFIYLDVEKAMGFDDSPTLRGLLEDREMQQRIQTLRKSERVSYGEAAEIKKQFLWDAYLSFLKLPSRNPLRVEFESFMEKQGELLDLYAAFMALYERFAEGTPSLRGWRNWPSDYHSPRSNAVKRFKERNERKVNFHKYLQWELDRQLSRVEDYAVEKGLGIGLYHDLPLAVDGMGFDAWMQKNYFAPHMDVGAPPDPFSPNGQNWGFAPILPRAFLMDGYKFFIKELRRNMRPNSALRIDHAMRFFRLFWIPQGRSPFEGAYVRYNAEDLYGILVLESVRNRCLIISEDLGTVPPYVREFLARRGIFSYRLLYFEKDDTGNFKLPHEYPHQALVSITTHDLPPLEAYWKGLDIEARHSLGKFVTEESYLEEWKNREQDKARLLVLLKERGLLPWYHPTDIRHVPSVTPELHNAVIGFVAQTQCKLLLINQEDIFRDERQQNMPGTSCETPNWVTRMRFCLEELNSDPVAVGCTRMVRNWMETTGRS